MFNFFQTIVNNFVMIFTTITVSVTSFFIPSKSIPSLTPIPTTQQVLIQEETTPTQTSQRNGSKSIVRQKVSPILTATITQIQSTNPTPTQSPNSLPSNGDPQVKTEKPVACFTISGNYFDGDGYAYGRPINVDASCSKNALIYLWYMNGFKINKLEPPVNEKVATLFQSGLSSSYTPLTSDVTYEIKLTVASAKSKLTDTIVKAIKVKKVDPIEFCFTPDSGTRKNINFNEEVLFSASCTKDSTQNPITKFFWKFRDGDINNSVIKEGKEVSHKFTKYAENFMGGNTGIEAELCVETKWGIAGCSIQHFNIIIH